MRRLVLLPVLVLFGCASGGPATAPEAEYDAPPATLHEAADRGDLAAMQAFLDAGADPSEADTTDALVGPLALTPLHRAAGSGHTEAVALLLASGADLAAEIAPLWGGGTPLFSAARGGHLDVVTMLVEAGAEVEMFAQANYKSGDTPLNAAAEGGDLAVVQYLIAAGGDPAMGGTDGEPPLAFAATGVTPGHTEVLRYLLSLGLDPNETNAWGVHNALTRARQQLDLLDDSGERAVMEQHIQILVDAGATLPEGYR